jgi:molybdopterin-binding protein
VITTEAVAEVQLASSQSATALIKAGQVIVGVAA